MKSLKIKIHENLVSTLKLSSNFIMFTSMVRKYPNIRMRSISNHLNIKLENEIFKIGINTRIL
jgi:hypothetical protein